MEVIYECSVDNTDALGVDCSSEEIEFSISLDNVWIASAVLDRDNVKALRDQLNQFLGDSNEHTV